MDQWRWRRSLWISRVQLSIHPAALLGQQRTSQRDPTNLKLQTGNQRLKFPQKVLCKHKLFLNFYFNNDGKITEEIMLKVILGKLCQIDKISSSALAARSILLKPFWAYSFQVCLENLITTSKIQNCIFKSSTDLLYGVLSIFCVNQKSWNKNYLEM